MIGGRFTTMLVTLDGPDDGAALDVAEIMLRHGADRVELWRGERVQATVTTRTMRREG